MVIIYKYIAILYKFIFNTFFSFNLHLMFLWLVLGFYRIFSGSGVDNSHKIQYDLRPSIKDLLGFFLFLVDFVKCTFLFLVGLYWMIYYLLRDVNFTRFFFIIHIVTAWNIWTRFDMCSRGMTDSMI